MIKSLFSTVYTQSESIDSDYAKILQKCREHIRMNQESLRDLVGEDINSRIRELISEYIVIDKPSAKEFVGSDGIVNTKRMELRLYEDINQFGPITQALSSPDKITDIYCVGIGPGTLYTLNGLKREYIRDANGNLLYYKTGDEILSVINKLSSASNLHLSRQNPILYAQTLHGYRLTANDASMSSFTVLPNGEKVKVPTFSIRLGAKKDITLDDMVYKFKTIHPEIATVLKTLIKLKALKIFISGIPGTGKTTIMSEMLTSLENKFLFTSERTPELQLWRYNEDGTPKNSIRGMIATMDDIDTNDTSLPTPYNIYLMSLREKVDIYVIGEIRSVSETRVAMDASASGEGTMSTIHGEDEETTIERIVKNIQQAKNVNRAEAMEEAYLAANLIINMEASEIDGIIRVKSISEVCKEETALGTRLTFNRLYEFKRTSRKINPETGRIYGNYQKVGVPQKRLLKYIDNSNITDEEEELLLRDASPEHPIKFSEVW